MRFVLRRLGFFVVTVWAAVSFNFLIPRLMPGNPVQALVAQHPHLGPQAIHALTVLLGGDRQPEPSVLSTSSTGSTCATFNFGISITTSFGTSVSTMVFQALPWTLGLVGLTTVIAFVLGTFIGLLERVETGQLARQRLAADLRHHLGLPVLLDRAARRSTCSPSGSGCFPNGGAYNFLTDSPGLNWHYVGDVLQHAFLPAMTILITSIGGWILTMRNNVITVLAEDYVRMARAKGLKPWRVMWNYAGKNAILPNLTGFAMSLGFVVSGAILVEYVFNYPGVGSMLLTAVKGTRLPAHAGPLSAHHRRGAVQRVGADIVTAILDPRTRELG